MISELRDLICEERLKEFNNPRIKEINRRSNLSFYKISNGYENIYRNIFVSLKKDNKTRGHKVTLVRINVYWK